MKKAILVSGIVLAVILPATISVLLYVDFDSPALGNEVLEKAREITGLNLKAAEFRLKLAEGLIWEDVEADVRFPGGRYSIHIERMMLEHRLLPLVAGKIIVQRVVLEKPRIEVSRVELGSDPTSRTRAAPEREKTAEVDEPTERSSEAFRFDLSLLVSDIQLNDATVTVAGFQPGQTGLSIRGFHVGLQNMSVRRGALTLLHALTATGELRIGRFVMETVRARDLKGSLVLDRGRVELRDLELTAESGTFVSGLEVDFNRIPFAYAMNLEGGPLDVQLLAGLEEGDGLGPGHLELDVEGFGGSTKNMRGEGVLRLVPGKVPAHPVLMNIERALGEEDFVGSPYAQTEVQFQIREDKLILEPFSLEIDTVTVEVSGAVHRDGPLELNLAVRRPRESSSVTERFQMTGTLKEPHVNQ
jgi:hypothetical protein